jgi:hydroxybutyrate-dimer hydrolase
MSNPPAEAPRRARRAPGAAAAFARRLGEPVRHELDGVDDDLLTAGLGLAGLRGPPPGFKVPARPTPRELRRRAIHAAYRGLVDTSAGGGCGRLHGPPDGLVVPGTEILVAVATPDGTANTTVMLQLPRAFDRARPVLLAVAASGSRGVYGGLPTAGVWGLRRGHAVVYTDKGAGSFAWDLDRRRGYRIDGTLSADPADPLLGFVPALDAELDAYAARHPGTLLMKHAHSRQNPEADWGTYLLQAIATAFELLNEAFAGGGGPRLDARNTLVMAAGVSNGGAAVLRALEQDRGRVISGAVAVEPSVVLAGQTAGLAIRHRGRRFAGEDFLRGDYTELHYLLQPAAVLAEHDATAPLSAATSHSRPEFEAWTRALVAAGVLPPGSPADIARLARERLLAAGILPEALRLGHFNLASSLWSAIVATYASAYARRSPADPALGFSFAASDASGAVGVLGESQAAALWADGSGIAPTAGIALVMTDANGARRVVNGGTVETALVTAPERLFAYAARPRVPAATEVAARAGRLEAVMTGRLGNRPVILVHGRADSLIPVNHGARGYYALNQRERGSRDELYYYELEHAQHFDNCLALPEFAAEFVPVQPWLERLLDALEARLTAAAPLWPSQVIRSRPRGSADGGVPPLAAEHLGALSADPGADAIRYADGVLTVPD